MSDERELAERVRSAIARVPVTDGPFGIRRRRSLSGLAAVAAAFVVLIAALGAGRWLADYRAGSAAGGSCGSLDVMTDAPPPLRTIRLDQRWTIDGLGTRCIAGIRVYDGFFDIISYQDGTPSYAEPWTSASAGLSLGVLSDDRGRTFASSASGGLKTASGQTVRLDQYEAFPNPSQQTRGDLLAGVHELRFTVQQVLQAVHGPWRFDGIAAKNGALSVAAAAAGRELHLYDLVLRSDGFSVAYLPLGEVKTGSVVVTDPLIAQDDRGTTYKFAGNERVGSSANLYAKFSPAPPAGALLHIEIPTIYVTSDQTWTGTLTLPAAAAAPTATATTAPSPAPTASAASGPHLRWSQPVTLPDRDAIYDVLKWHDHYVAVGQSSDGTAYVGAAFTSPDGLHWQRTATFRANPELVATSSRLIAFVAHTDAPYATEAWSSTDGRNWQRESQLDLTNGAITSVVARGDTLVASGLGGQSGTQMWRSDGNGWATIDRLPAPMIVRSLSVVSDGFLAVGRLGSPDTSSGGVGAPGVGRPQAWWSADGRSWSSEGVEGVDAPGGQLTEVFRVSTGYLAVGSDTTNASESARKALLWSSSDGHSWKLLGAPAHWGIASSDGQQLLIFGYADAQTGLLGPWSTRDGTTWTQPIMTGDQADIPAFIGTANRNSRVDNIHAFPDGVVVIGQQNGQMTAWFAAKD